MQNPLGVHQHDECCEEKQESEQLLTHAACLFGSISCARGITRISTGKAHVVLIRSAAFRGATATCVRSRGTPEALVGCRTFESRRGRLLCARPQGKTHRGAHIFWLIRLLDDADHQMGHLQPVPSQSVAVRTVRGAFDTQSRIGIGPRIGPRCSEQRGTEVGAEILRVGLICRIVRISGAGKIVGIARRRWWRLLRRGRAQQARKAYKYQEPARSHRRPVSTTVGRSKSAIVPSSGSPSSLLIC
jgi:hypothetical protein